MMKEISEEVLFALGVKYMPRFKYYTTEDGKIFSYTKKGGLKERRPVYDPFKLYNVVGIGGKTMLWHRVILMNYIEQPENKPHCNHINGNKLDNRLCNLEWCDNSYNIMEAQRLGLKPTIKLYQFTKSGELVKIWNSVNDAAKKYGVGVFNTIRHGTREGNKKWYKTSKGFVRNTEPVFPQSLIND